MKLSLLLLLIATLKTNAQQIGVVTVAGQWTNGYADGQGTLALFTGPMGIAIHKSTGTIYINEESANRIRKMTSNCYVSTLAGSGTQGFLDGQGTTASFSYPRGIAVDQNSDVYISDLTNHRIRKITANGLVSTLAGTGTNAYNDGFGTYASFSYPAGIAVDPSGSGFIYTVELGYSQRVRKISSVGQVTTVAGNGVSTFANGPASAASFSDPEDVTLDSAGNIYVSEYSNHRVRKVSTAGQVTTLAGSGTAAYFDATGGLASFKNPYGIDVDSSGNVYVADVGNNRIRKIASNGVVTTIAGNGAGGTLDGASTSATVAPRYLELDSNGVLWFPDAYGPVRQVLMCSQIFDLVAKSCACNDGYYLTSPIACTLCPAGMTTNSTKNGCTLCPLGQFKNSSMITCSNCPQFYTSSADRMSCICQSGYYLPPRASQCLTCPIYATCNYTAITSCQAGYKSTAAGDGCEACPAGTQTSGDSLSCDPCVGSTYRTNTMTSCQSCPVNSVCTTIGLSCNAGYTLNVAGTGCDQCPLGYAKSSTGNGVCAQCSAGNESASDRQSCVACSAGYYRSNLNINKCVSCPFGATCSASTITRCANGYKINSAGDNCEQCLIGYHSTDGVNCVLCPSGSAKPSQDYDTCFTCPAGGTCAGSAVTCQTGYFFDGNVKCKRNDTYFSLLQTATGSLSTVTSFITVTQPASTVTETSISKTNIYATSTLLQSATAVSTFSAISFQTVTQSAIIQTVTQSANTVTVTVSQNPQPGSVQQQSQPANSVPLDFIGLTLPISPLIFAASAFGAGLFVMLILSLVCCRKPPSRKRDEEFDGVSGMTTTMNTQGQRTFTNSTLR